MTLSSPFRVEGVYLKSVLEKLYQRKNKLVDDILAALIIDHRESRAWFMENKHFEKVFE